MAGYDFDMLVIGSGPSGQKAAIAGAKLGKRVAVIDRRAAEKMALFATFPGPQAMRHLVQ